MSKVVLKVNNIVSNLLTTDQDLKDTFYELLRFRPKNFWHNPKYQANKWDGWKNFFDKKSGAFLTGLLPEVQKALALKRVEYFLIDNRIVPQWSYESIGQDFLNNWLPKGHSEIELHDFQPDLVNMAIQYNRGIIQAPTGCHRIGQKVLMYDGSLKKVEDVVVGDQLMGMDSTPRNVLELCRGIDEMYKIVPLRGTSFVVNGDHTLSLMNFSGDIIDVTVNEYMTWSITKKAKYNLFSKSIEFNNDYNPTIDPYLLGEMIGKEKIKNEEFKDHLIDLGLWDCEKLFIPSKYKTLPKKDRLQFLRGIAASGKISDCRLVSCRFDSKKLVYDVVQVARSLGIDCGNPKKHEKKREDGSTSMFWSVWIEEIKESEFCLSEFSIITLNILEKYYGFMVDGDNRYLLDDFTVTHNSGKTYILISILKSLPPKTPVLFLTKNKGLVHQNYEEMKLWGVENLGRWYSKYKEPNYIMCATIHPKTFESLEKLLPKFKAVIVDEVHDCVSAVPIKAYKKMVNASIRIGISATAFKWDKKKIDDVHKWTVKGHFGPVFKTNTTEDGNLKTIDLQKRGILSESDCYFYTISHPDLKYEPYADAVKLGIEQNFHLHEMVTNLARRCSGRTLIVVERIEQGEYLSKLMPEACFIQGKNSLKEREPIINALKQGEKTIAIAMRHIITAGINVKIHDLINAAGGDSAHNIIQLMGRGLRTADDKTMLRYHDFYFKNNDYLRKHSEWRIKVIKKEGHRLTIKESI